MDALTADIAAKLIIQDDPVNAADIERLKQDEELNVREDKEKVVRALKEGAEAKAAAAKPSKVCSSYLRYSTKYLRSQPQMENRFHHRPLPALPVSQR